MLFSIVIWSPLIATFCKFVQDLNALPPIDTFCPSNVTLSKLLQDKKEPSKTEIN